MGRLLDEATDYAACSIREAENTAPTLIEWDEDVSATIPYIPEHAMLAAPTLRPQDDERTMTTEARATTLPVAPMFAGRRTSQSVVITHSTTPRTGRCCSRKPRR